MVVVVVCDLRPDRGSEVRQTRERDRDRCLQGIVHRRVDLESVHHALELPDAHRGRQLELEVPAYLVREDEEQTGDVVVRGDRLVEEDVEAELPRIGEPDDLLAESAGRLLRGDVDQVRGHGRAADRGDFGDLLLAGGAAGVRRQVEQGSLSKPGIGSGHRRPPFDMSSSAAAWASSMVIIIGAIGVTQAVAPNSGRPDSARVTDALSASSTEASSSKPFTTPANCQMPIGVTPDDGGSQSCQYLIDLLLKM